MTFVRQLVTLFQGTELEDFRRQGVYLARVVDERGGTTGVVFLEDMFEELVGTVEDATQRV